MKKVCSGCQTKFDGRKDAKTCSARCRKRLQRLNNSLKNVTQEVNGTVRKAEQKLEDTLVDLKQDLLIPQEQTGFIEISSDISDNSHLNSYQFPKNSKVKKESRKIKSDYTWSKLFASERKPNRPTPMPGFKYAGITAIILLVAVSSMFWLGLKSKNDLSSLKSQQETSSTTAAATQLQLDDLSKKVDKLNLLTNDGQSLGSGSGDASGIMAGTLDNSRLSTIVTLQGNSINIAGGLVQLNALGALPVLSGANLTELNATNISSGTLDTARLNSLVTIQGNTFNGASGLVQLTATGLLPVLSGANLTTLNGTNITTGTVADARLSSNVTLVGNIFNAASKLVQLNSAGALPVLSGANLTNLNAGNLSGTLPALNGAALTSVNASSLGGTTFAAPGPIGSGTPSTGAFTTLTSSGTTDLANAGASNVTIATTGTGTVAIGNTTGAITVGALGAAGGTIILGQATTATAVAVNISSANSTESTQTVEIGGGTSTTSGGKIVNIANGVPGATTTNTVAIGTGGTTTGTVGITIGSNGAAAHTLVLQGGNGVGAVSIQAATSGTISIGTANANTLTLGNTSGSISLNSNTTVAAGKTLTFTSNANTPGLLVLGVRSNTGEAGGTPIVGAADGAMYYNSADHKFRCNRDNVWFDCFGIPRPGSKRISYLTFTNRLTTVSPTGFGVAGISALSGDGSGATSQIGVAGPASPNSGPSIKLSTIAGANSRAGYSVQSFQSGDKDFYITKLTMFQTDFELSTTSDIRAWSGLTDQAAAGFATANPVGNVAAFRYDTSVDTKWKCVLNNGNATVSATDSTITPSGRQRFEIQYIVSTSTWVFSINGAQVCSIAGDSKAPNAALVMPAVSVMTLNSAILNGYFSYFYTESDW